MGGVEGCGELNRVIYTLQQTQQHHLAASKLTLLLNTGYEILQVLLSKGA